MSSNASREKTERLLNLTIALLATRRFLSREEIRAMVPGYSEHDEAFERAFERDKDDLREMGIPIETGSNSAVFEDEPGYRIRRDAYALPEVRFTGAEMAVLALAAQAWAHAALGAPAATALHKLKAYSPDLDDAAAAGLAPRVDTREATFLPLWRAVRDGRAVRFDYRGSGEDHPANRTVEPWGIVSWRGRWYLVGHDRDREATRVFRLSRVVGEVRAFGAPGSVTASGDVDLRAQVAAIASQSSTGQARVRLRHGAGGLLRRRATAITASALAGWDELELPYADVRQLAEDLASLGAAAVALEPPELRAQVLDRLRAAAGSQPSQPSQLEPSEAGPR